MTESTIPAHIEHRIAEAVGKGWPAFEVTPMTVHRVLALAEKFTEAKRISVAVGVSVQVVEAILAEASAYDLPTTR